MRTIRLLLAVAIIASTVPPSRARATPHVVATRPAAPAGKPDPAIKPPVAATGQPQPNAATTLGLDVHPGTADGPRVVAALGEGGVAPREFTPTADFQAEQARALSQALKAAKKERGGADGAGLRVLINAAHDARFADVQLMLQHCAVAGITDYGFVTRPAGDGAADRQFLPGTMPVVERPKPGQPEPATPPPAHLEVFVGLPGPADATGRPALKVSVGDDPRLIGDADELTRTLARKLKAAKVPPERIWIVVCPRLESRHDHVVAAYEAAASAGFSKIGFQSARD